MVDLDNINDIKLVNVKRILDEYALKFQELAKKKIVDNDNVATGNLLASIKTSIDFGGNKYTVYLHSREYLKYIEEGTKPHFPPPDKILQWVKDKKLPTRESTGDKSLPTEKQLTYLVCRKISIHGTEPNGLIAETQEQLNEIYIKRLEEALTQDIVNWLPIIKIELRFK